MIRWRSRCCSRVSRDGRSSRGFTILEVVAVMAVMALATGLGSYYLGDWRARGQFNGIVNGMRNAIHLTRSRAIARQKPVVLQIAKPVSRDAWKHSENYVVVERSEPTDPDGRFYWIEFQYVWEREKDGTPYYMFLVGDPSAPELIDSSLNYSDADGMNRGQVCFNGRGYAVSPTSTSVPRSFVVDVLSDHLKRKVRLNVSPLGQVTTQSMGYSG